LWQALREDKPDKGFSPNPLPPPTLMDISPTKSENYFALIPVEWFQGIVNIPILYTLLHVTVATTIVVLAWQDLL
jgi:hypothetical protein